MHNSKPFFRLINNISLNYFKCECSGPSGLIEEDCGGHVLSRVCLELPWDSSQNEHWAGTICVCVVLNKFWKYFKILIHENNICLIFVFCGCCYLVSSSIQSIWLVRKIWKFCSMSFWIKSKISNRKNLSKLKILVKYLILHVTFKKNLISFSHDMKVHLFNAELYLNCTNSEKKLTSASKIKK